MTLALILGNNSPKTEKIILKLQEYVDHNQVTVSFSENYFIPKI